MAERIVNVPINYKVNVVEIERVEAASKKADEATQKLRQATQSYAQQGAAGFKSVSRNIEGMEIELARLRQQMRLTSTEDTKRLSQLSDQYRVLKARIDEANKSLFQQSKITHDTASATKGLANQLGDVYNTIKLVIAAGLVREFVDMNLEAAKLVGNIEGVKLAFDRIPGSVVVLQKLREATHGAVNDLELMQKALKAQNFGISLKALPQLLEFAAVRAQQTGVSVEYLVNSIVDGIGRKSLRVLDNLQIAQSRIKKELGAISIEAASVGQVSEAMGRIASEELQKMGGYAETAATEVDQLATAYHELKVEVSRKIEEGGLVSWFKKGVEAAMKFVKAFPVKEFQQMFDWWSINPIVFVRRMSDVVANWKLNLEQVVLEEQILNNALKERANIEEKANKLKTDEQKVKFIQNEIDKRVETIAFYDEEIKKNEDLRKSIEEKNPWDPQIEKINQTISALKINKQELQEINKLLKETQDLTKTKVAPGDPMTGEKVDNSRGHLMKPLTAVVDIRFKDPVTGAIIKGQNDKAIADISGGLIDSLNAFFDNNDPVKAVQIPMKPFIKWDELDKAFEENKEVIKDTAFGIVNDLIQSSLDAEVYALDRRIDATKDYYDRQVELAGDNERRKKELRLKEDDEIKKLEKRRADREKKAALAGIRVSTALGIMKVFAGEGTFFDKLIKAAIVTAQGLSQYAIAGKERYYAKGEIDIKGPGTGTSDSIPARLSRGESVMTAEETQRSKGVLKAIRAKRLNDRVLRDIVQGRSGGSSAQQTFDDSRIVSKLDEIKNSQPNIEERGNLLYKSVKKGDAYWQKIRVKSMGR